jgi:hypothetical protein
VGIAFQSLTGNSTQSVGYVIPTSVVRHFLDDVRMHGQYMGFPSLVSAPRPGGGTLTLRLPRLRV